MEINKNIFGTRLKQLMKSYGETTYSLGRHFKLSPPSISRYTRGEMAPKMTTLYALADYFDVNPEWLMGEPVSMYSSDVLDDSDIDADKSLVNISVFDEIRYDLPIFSNHRLKKELQMPLEQLSKWGPVFGYRIPDESMSPILQPGDLVVIRLDTELQSGNAVAFHANRENMKIRKVIVQGSQIIAQPVNPNADAVSYHIQQDHVQIIGRVVYCLHQEETYFKR
ncbi:MAG: helix-turn-helix domain-containing protein [Pseudoramibacter sp.]